MIMKKIYWNCYSWLWIPTCLI